MQTTRYIPLWIALSACGGGSWDEIRAAWLVDAIVDDNRVWLSRDLSLLAGKYEVMAADPYDFMRGTASIFFRDLERAGTLREPTAFVSSAEAAEILIAGDPHPENVGVMLPGPDPADIDRAPALLLELNDFDTAGFGPYTLDVRRAMLGLSVLLEGARCGPACRDRVRRVALESWFDGVTSCTKRPEDCAIPAVLGRASLLDDLVGEVLEEGPDRILLEEVTTLGPDGLRRLSLDEALDESGLGTLAPTQEERAQAERLLAAYPGGFELRIHDVARRYGVGVASRPAVRYVVAYDRGESGPEDDALLQMREVVDPPALYNLPTAPVTLLDGNDHRSVASARVLWSHPEADGRLDAIRDGAMTFKVQTWSSWFQALDHIDIISQVSGPVPDEAALSSLAALLGEQLAGAHARSLTASGAPAGPVIVGDLAGRKESFVAERLAEAEPDLARTLADHARFVEALSTYGPLLGASELGP